MGSFGRVPVSPIVIAPRRCWVRDFAQTQRDSLEHKGPVVTPKLRWRTKSRGRHEGEGLAPARSHAGKPKSHGKQYLPVPGPRSGHSPRKNPHEQGRPRSSCPKPTGQLHALHRCEYSPWRMTKRDSKALAIASMASRKEGAEAVTKSAFDMTLIEGDAVFAGHQQTGAMMGQVQPSMLAI